MRELSLHLLDLAENSVSAQATRVVISVDENLPADRLTLRVGDNGLGMDPESVRKLTDPFFTSRTSRSVGLGIPLLVSAAEGCNGNFEIDSQVGRGTKIKIEFQHSHIDRMPLGDLAGTFLTLLVAHPETSWKFNYLYQPSLGSRHLFEFDDIPVKQTLGDLPLTQPDVLIYFKELFHNGVNVANLEPTPSS